MSETPFLPVPPPPWALSPYHEKHCVHISPLHTAEPLWYRYTYPETITIEQMVQNVPPFVFVCCCCSLTPRCFFFCFPRQTHRLNEHASLCFLRISSESRMSRDLFLKNVRRWGGGWLSVSVWLYWTWWGMILWWMLLPLWLWDEEGSHLSHARSE